MAIELVTTDGIFALDGGEWEVTNNIWLVGDDREVLIFDAAHDHRPIVAAVNGRRVAAIVLTHGHNDHINAAEALREEVDAPVMLHPADRMLWDTVYPESSPDADVVPGSVLSAGGHTLAVLHTPGHSPGCCCFHDADSNMVLSGDTLFCGGPGATGRSFSDEPTILRSIRDRLLSLPDHTVVHTGHGETTMIGDERPRVLERIAELALAEKRGMDSIQLSQREKQPGHDRTFQVSEREFVEVARRVLDPTEYRVEDQPGDLTAIFTSQVAEDRALGVKPDASVESLKTGRRFFVEVKKQGPQGNAHERAFKHHTVQFYETLKEIYGYDYHPFVTVCCENLATDSLYTTKFPYLFEPHHYLLWVDYDEDVLATYLIERCAAWLDD